MASISLAYVDQVCFEGPKARLIKAMGRSCYDRTAPIPVVEASVVIKKGSLKLGIANVGVAVKAFFKAKKEASASWDQKNLPFFSKLVNGWARIP